MIYKTDKIIITRHEVLSILEDTYNLTVSKIDQEYPLPDGFNVKYSTLAYGHIGLLKSFHEACIAFVNRYPNKMDGLLYIGLYIGLNRVKDDYLFRHLKDDAIKSDIAYWVNYYLKETKI